MLTKLLVKPHASAQRMRRVMPGFARQLRGQALVLFVTLLGVLCLGVILLFNTGQVVNKKVRLTNAVDAAAYSVAVQQARVLNFAAYMNRGRVANEVAIAQAVSLNSWVNYVHTHTIIGQTVFQVLSSIPLIGLLFTPVMSAYVAARNGIAAVHDGIRTASEAAITLLDTINEALANAALQMVDSVATVESLAIAYEVLRMNDPDATLDPAGAGLLGGQLSAVKSDLLVRYRLPERDNTTDVGMDRYRNVVMDSRDGFSRDRGDRLRIFNLTVWPTRTRVNIEAYGGTDMVSYRRWAAMDTLALYARAEVWGCLFGCGWGTIIDQDTPFGWGGAQAVENKNNLQKKPFLPGINDGKGWRSDYDGRTWAPYGGMPMPALNIIYNPAQGGFVPGMSASVTTWLADADPAVKLEGYQRRDAFHTTYRGLRDYDDTKRRVLPDDGPVFTVYATSAADRVRTSDRVGIGARNGGDTDLRGAARQGRYTAVASAQVYFHRPPAQAAFKRLRMLSGRSNEFETGNLFSPYWQARLAETPASAYAQLGVGG